MRERKKVGKRREGGLEGDKYNVSKTYYPFTNLWKGSREHASVKDMKGTGYVGLFCVFSKKHQPADTTRLEKNYLKLEGQVERKQPPGRSVNWITDQLMPPNIFRKLLLGVW